MNLIHNIIEALNIKSSPATIWAVIASLAACISAISAFRSSRFAKRMYKLAYKNYNDRQSNFNLYLVESYRWASKETKRKFLLFHLTINNKSDSKNSYNATLEIEYIRTDQTFARVTFPHNETLHTLIPQKNITTFNNDIRIEEKGIQSKWLIFEQPTIIFDNYKIARYVVKITDVLGNFEVVESFIIKELSNDQKKEN